MAGRRRAGTRVRERVPGAWRAKGRQVRHPRANHARVGAHRLCARTDGRHRCAGVRIELRVRRRLPAFALRGRGGRLRGRRATSQSGGRLARVVSARACAHVPRPRRTGRARARLRGGESDCARRRVGCDLGGRPLHDHLHLGDDRAAEGLHAEPSQLLRDDERRRPDGQLLPRRRPDALVPALGAQLRPADAADRRIRRLPDRSTPRPASSGRGAAAGAPDGPTERPACVREGAHGRPGALRRRDGHANDDSSTGHFPSGAK